MAARAPLLTLRELNRALLARQMLLERGRLSVVGAIERLGCLQGQWAPAPYVGLWSRVAGFEGKRLTRAIDNREVVKATLMRGTLHLVSAREYPAYAVATAEGRFKAWRPPGSPEMDDLETLRKSVLAFAAKTPRSREDLKAHIVEHFPARARKDERLRSWFLYAAVAMTGLIWDSPGARFDHRQLARFIAPPAALRRNVRPEDAYDLIVRRHLGAFGPATVADVASWSSVRVPHIREALARIKGLVRFTDERGRELFDLAKAPRPAPDAPAPVRFLARFDAAILGHVASERARILPERWRRQVIFSAEVWQTFIVDGFVAGRWTIAVRPREAVLELKPFAPLKRADRAALVAEGERLVRFYAPDATTHVVRG
jgi:winged helix DNA-binding protein